MISKPELCWTESIKLVKNKDFFMFVSVSYKGKLSIMNRGQIKNIERPLEYYYNKAPEYANLVLQKFSQYWDALNNISSQIKSIKPDIKYIKKYKYGGYKRDCMIYGLPIKSFNEWYKDKENTFRFEGTVHGCIVDFDYSNHVFLNPYDGKITAYSAPSMYEKYLYENVVSLVASRRPEMLTGFKECCNNVNLLQSNTENIEQNSIIPLNKESNRDIIKLFNESDKIVKKTELVENTDIYTISNRLKALQMIYDYGLIVEWYDDILPHMEIEEKAKSKNKSILSQSAEMKCRMNATVIADNGPNDITVEFEDGTIVKHQTRQQFKNRNIKNPVLEAN